MHTLAVLDRLVPSVPVSEPGQVAERLARQRLLVADAQRAYDALAADLDALEHHITELAVDADPLRRDTTGPQGRVAQREAQALAERLGEAATTCRRLGLDEVHLRDRLARTQAAEAQTVLEATGRQARRAYARYRDAGLALRGLREEFLEALHAHDRARRHPALASAHGPAASLVTPRDGRTWAPGLFIELVDPWAEP